MLTPLLFEPITLGGLRVPNRLTMPPMHANLGSMQEGVTDRGPGTSTRSSAATACVAIVTVSRGPRAVSA